MSIKHLYEDERPSLLLDFANSKTLDPRITFTRNSTATYVDELGVIKTAASGEARFDHDPATGESLGLLIEEERENFNNQSVDFSVYSEHPTAGLTVRTANAGIAPDGTNTAFKIYPSGSQPGVYDRCWIFRNFGNLNLASGTNSVFAKADGKRYLHVFTVYGGYGAQFDLQDGVVTSTHDSSITATIEDYGNGWYRCSATDSETSTFNQCGLYVSDSATGADIVPSGSGGTDGILIWGYQTEKGSFPTSYIPTSGSTVQRLADEASITGTNFSSWYNPSGGTIVTSFYPFNEGKAYTLHNGSANQRIILDTTDAGTGFGITGVGNYAVSNPGDTTVQIGVVDPNINVTIKNAFRVEADNHGAANNGSLATAAPTAPMPLATTLQIFTASDGTSNPMSGYLHRFAYYPAFLSDTTLEELTK